MRLSLSTIIKSIMLLLVLMALAVGGHLIYTRLPDFINHLASDKTRTETSLRQEVVVTIPKGASLSEVGEILQNNNIVSSKTIFKLVAMIRGEQRNVKAGDYQLKTSSDAGEVLDLLISGKTLVYAVTIPEGYNIFQVADLLEQKGLASRKEVLSASQEEMFLKELGIEVCSLEGVLFPDTYFIRPSEKGSAKSIIRKMVNRFREVYDLNVREVAHRNGWSLAQVITLASLIEKEAKANEHALVSAVFHNRLRKNMRLQSDPTVIYGIKPMGAKITRSDLDRKHPYNTYQIAGLPPGPIANPGKDSLMAAVNPADVDYLYFVSKNDGTHQFSSNLSDHNRWVNLYQRQPSSVTQ
jgi:UPF0755 protein